MNGFGLGLPAPGPREKSPPPAVLPGPIGHEPPAGVIWLGAAAPSPGLEKLLAERGLTLSLAPGPEAAAVATGDRAVLCFGPGASAPEVLAALDRASRGSPSAPCLALILGDAEVEGLHDLLEDERLFYIAPGPLPEHDLAALIESAAQALDPRRRPPVRRARPEAVPIDRVLRTEALRRLALASTAAEMAAALGAAVCSAVAAGRGRCLLFDRERQALWAPDDGANSSASESPALGLASFALRTGLAVCLPRAGDDPRFDRELDDPDGEPGDRLLGVPVATGDGEVVAVLVALRSPEEFAFEPGEVAALEAVASHVVPYVLPWVPVASGAAEPAAGGGSSHPFRRRALAELELPAAAGLEPIRLAPRWTAAAYWLSLALLLVAVLAAALVRVPEYASGVAVVRAGGRVEVTATASGTVTRLAVTAHQPVRRGQLLLALHSAEEAAGLERLEQELEQKLVQRLQSPDDPGVADGLIALRAERELARARLAERELRAPADGEASDVRVAPGQYLTAGQPVLSLLTGPEPPSVVALLPGRYLPQLSRGMKLRLELPGHPYVYRWLALDSVAEEVIGPAEARRLLGPVAGDAVALDGPLAAVTAALPEATFEVGGWSYPYREGMPSRAEVRVRSERLLFALLPALRGVAGGPRG